MDEESKKVFDALLGEKHAKRYKPAAKAPWREFKSHVDLDYAATEPKRPERPSAYEFTHVRKPAPPVEHEYGEFHTQDYIAVLSVNQAKACIVFKAPTNTAVRNEITRLAGPNQAKYNKQDDVWELHPAILPGLKLVLKTHYKDVQVLGVQKQVQATKFDQLMARLSKDDKDKIYKLLALKYHPDKGGDKETMVLVNLVFKGGA